MVYVKHQISSDGLSATSTAFINGREVQLTIEWDDEETAEQNYTRFMNDSEKQLQEMNMADYNSSPVNNDAKRLFVVGDREYSFIRMTGNRWDAAAVRFGNKKWKAPVINGHVSWKQLKAVMSPSKKPEVSVFGFGGKSSAFFLKVRKVK